MKNLLIAAVAGFGLMACSAEPAPKTEKTVTPSAPVGNVQSASLELTGST